MGGAPASEKVVDGESRPLSRRCSTARDSVSAARCHAMRIDLSAFASIGVDFQQEDGGRDAPVCAGPLHRLVMRLFMVSLRSVSTLPSGLEVGVRLQG